MVSEAAMTQAIHIGPAELTALLVQSSARAACRAVRSGVQFSGMSHAFGKAMTNPKYHCLHWSSNDSIGSPATCFPLVGEKLQFGPSGDGLLRTVNSQGTVSQFYTKEGRSCFVGLVKLFQGIDDDLYTRKIVQIHESWSFHSQIISEEESNCGNPAKVVELFCKKLVMWIFGYYARDFSKQLTLLQLETAFPLITAVNVHERRRFVSGVLDRFSGGLLSFYDDRVIVLKRVPVHALSLLSTEELRMATSVEQASVTFLFRCQMRHDEVLEALHTILETWGKRGSTSASLLLRLAVAVLLSHVVGTSALLPQGAKNPLRPFVLRYLPVLLSLRDEPFVSKLITLLRPSKSHKGSSINAVRKKLGEIVLDKTLLPDLSSTCTEQDAGAELNEKHFFDSVAPLPHVGTDVVWKIAKGTCSHALVSPPSANALINTEPNEMRSGDRLLSAALFCGARLQLTRPLLKSAEEEEMFLSLNIGKTSYSKPNDEEAFESVRKRRRMKGKKSTNEMK